MAGRVTTKAANWAAEILYVGTASGGLWKSTNGGLSWTQLLDAEGTMTIGTVAVDPNDPDLPDFADASTADRVDDHYQFRILERREFTP